MRIPHFYILTKRSHSHYYTKYDLQRHFRFARYSVTLINSRNISKRCIAFDSIFDSDTYTIYVVNACIILSVFLSFQNICRFYPIMCTRICIRNICMCICTFPVRKLHRCLTHTHAAMHVAIQHIRLRTSSTYGICKIDLRIFSLVIYSSSIYAIYCRLCIMNFLWASIAKWFSISMWRNTCQNIAPNATCRYRTMDVFGFLDLCIFIFPFIKSKFCQRLALIMSFHLIVNDARHF